MRRFLIPLTVFLLLVVLLGIGLGLRPNEVPSPLIGKPAPAFEAPRLHRPEARISHADLRGRVSVVNVWASWCVACRDEHPLLVELAQRVDAPVYGLNYKDQREDALRWLARFGDHYQAIIYDPQGGIGLDWGVYGVPETFILDHRGLIRHKHIGAIDREALEEEIIPRIRALQEQANG
ncbi:DsbE family thiol:disulfide interchange protein [Alkalilimnicola sp. S0819]|uniref:DsbE family thiol:disulfide interchange protein n=1 Tax=Alkalilimnicola sp. S0819 TaxID=2613922 RepID=UPI0012629385|nr:DsbE family thiol:disulfide interchange protein [Alkalilimnicola sp. S0819]KAB7627490.1 DsbE family thiol:disulfide interchange protein [Alkalilimnicola sp. S0819]MPQ15643.1 DsbE family thiol:disulfide interchange protein [Alkalilimnicola sp. S0819]